MLDDGFLLLDVGFLMEFSIKTRFPYPKSLNGSDTFCFYFNFHPTSKIHHPTFMAQ